MKTTGISSLFALGLLAAAASPLVAQTADAPKEPATPKELTRHRVAEFDQICKKSPFAFEIFAGPQTDKVNPFEGLTFSSIWDFGDRQEVTLVNMKTNQRTSANTQEPNGDGYQIVEIKRGETMMETVIKVRKGAEEGDLTMDKKIYEMRGSGAPNSAPQQGGRPGAPGQQPGQPGQPVMNGLNLNIPQAGNNGQAPKTGGFTFAGGSLPQPAVNGQQPAATNLPPPVINNAVPQPADAAAQQQGQPVLPKRRVILPPTPNGQTIPQPPQQQ